MGQVTAQLLFGGSGMYHGGILPAHAVWLRENGRPALVLEAVSGISAADAPGPATIWFPSSAGHFLEEAILLAAAHAFPDDVAGEFREEIRELCPTLLDSGSTPWLREETDPGALASLRESCKQLGGYKLVATVLGGSSLEQELPVLEQYPVQIEVCTVTYSMTWGGFLGPEEAEPAGSLTASWGSKGPTPDRYRAVNSPSSVPGALAEDRASSSSRLADLDLFSRWSEVMNELKSRNLIRATNSAPLAGYARSLVARYFGAEPYEGPDVGYDLQLVDGRTVRVKACRDPGGRSSASFDFNHRDDERFSDFVGVVFDKDLSVKVAVQMPWEAVIRLAEDSERKRRLHIRDLREAIDRDDTIRELDFGQWDHS